MIVYFAWRPWFADDARGFRFQKPWVFWVDKKDSPFKVKAPRFYDPIAKFGEEGYIDLVDMKEKEVERLYGGSK